MDNKGRELYSWGWICSSDHMQYGHQTAASKCRSPFSRASQLAYVSLPFSLSTFSLFKCSSFFKIHNTFLPNLVSHSLFPTFESALNLFFKLLNSLCLIPFICVCPPVTPDGELTTPLLRPVPAYPFLHLCSEEEHHSHFWRLKSWIIFTILVPSLLPYK